MSNVHKPVDIASTVKTILSPILYEHALMRLALEQIAQAGTGSTIDGIKLLAQRVLKDVSDNPIDGGL